MHHLTRNRQAKRLATIVALSAAAILIFAAQASARVYWTNYGTSVGRANVDGTGVEENFIPGGNETTGLAVSGSYIYWANAAGNSIGRANLDGSGVNQNFITGVGVTESLAIDEGQIYFTDIGTGSIGRANLDGTGVEGELITGIDPYFGIAVVGEHLYWVNEYDSIGRATVTGTEVEEEFIPDLHVTASYGMFANGEYIYWGDNAGTTIGRARLDGSGLEPEFITGLDDPGAIAVDGHYIYFTENGTDTIGRANLDGSGVEPELFATTGYPLGLATDVSQPKLTNAASSGFLLGTGALTDTATLSEGGGPTGTLTFRLYGPTDTTCTKAPVFTTTATVDGNGDYRSAAFTPTAGGTYRWGASYSGSFANLPAATRCGEAATTVATPPPPIPPNDFATRKVTHRKKPKGTASLAVWAASPGVIRITGPGIKTKTKTITAAGTYGLPLVPRGAYRQHLALHHRGYTNISVAFVPAGAEAKPALSIRVRLAWRPAS